jgi:hypothetical protein
MGDDPAGSGADNRRALAAAADVLSPELVLVSSSEEAARARELLPEIAFPVSVRSRRVLPTPSRAAGLVFDAICLTGTLGPLLLAVFAR